MTYSSNMNDFNMVNVDPQGQVGKSVDNIKLIHLRMDIRDHHEFLPVLKELQLTSSKVLKEFHEYLSRKEKKPSLPYNMIKKFQLLKGHFFSSSQVLNFQNRLYHTQVSNRDHDKMQEQLFFKKTLKSYDEKRLWMKNYILRNEAMVQTVEEVVKQNVEYEVHQYTEHRNQLNIERLEHNYDGKLEEGERCLQLFRRNAHLREQIKMRLASKIQNMKDQSVQEQPQQKKQEGAYHQRTSSNKCITLASFFNFYVTKQYIRNQFLRSETLRLKNTNKKLSQHNQQLKLAIDKTQQRLQFSNSEVAIIQQQLLHQSIHKQPVRQGKKLTKTDYLIYLKEIQRHCDQTLKIYGFYFVYSLSHRAFPNAFRSKSASKHYTMKPASLQVKQYCRKKLREQFLAYRQENKERIVRSKLQRQQKRRLEEQRKRLVLNFLQQSASKEQEKDKRSVDQQEQVIISEQVVLPCPQQSNSQLQLQEEEFHYI